jgi:RimJ/RimL family protein N-acetyltransferase
MTNKYIFVSKRLGFRLWQESDIAQMIKINADSDVMEFFPFIHDENSTKSFIVRMNEQYLKKNYCYFAVDTLVDSKFIGFIGLSEQTLENNSPSFVDIGWRLSKEAWNKGYATEGALVNIEYAFNKLNIKTVFSIAPEINLPSIHVMKKIGMKKNSSFIHPQLLFDNRLKNCVMYSIDNI